MLKKLISAFAFSVAFLGGQAQTTAPTQDLGTQTAVTVGDLMKQAKEKGYGGLAAAAFNLTKAAALLEGETIALTDTVDDSMPELIELMNTLPDKKKPEENTASVGTQKTKADTTAAAPTETEKSQFQFRANPSEGVYLRYNMGGRGQPDYLRAGILNSGFAQRDISIFNFGKSDSRNGNNYSQLEVIAGLSATYGNGQASFSPLTGFGPGGLSWGMIATAPLGDGAKGLPVVLDAGFLFNRLQATVPRYYFLEGRKAMYGRSNVPGTTQPHFQEVVLGLRSHLVGDKGNENRYTRLAAEFEHSLLAVGKNKNVILSTVVGGYGQRVNRALYQGEVLNDSKLYDSYGGTLGLQFNFLKKGGGRSDYSFGPVFSYDSHDGPCGRISLQARNLPFRR